MGAKDVSDFQLADTKRLPKTKNEHWSFCESIALSTDSEYDPITDELVSISPYNTAHSVQNLRITIKETPQRNFIYEEEHQLIPYALF